MLTLHAREMLRNVKVKIHLENNEQRANKEKCYGSYIYLTDRERTY